MLEEVSEKAGGDWIHFPGNSEEFTYAHETWPRKYKILGIIEAVSRNKLYLCNPWDLKSEQIAVLKSYVIR